MAQYKPILQQHNIDLSEILGVINELPQAGGGVKINAVTAPELPATVTDGQIVIITTTQTSTVYLGYVAPDNPVAGDVWIHTVDGGGYSFNISTIAITPGVTMQYNGYIWEYRNAYIGINGVWTIFSTQTPLALLTWEQIIAIANSGEDPSLFFAVGDEHELFYDNKTELTAVIGDFYHNTITGTNKKAPLAFTLKECIDTASLNTTQSNVGGWRDSYFRRNSIPNYGNRFPAELMAADAIKYVDVLTSYGNQATSIVTASDQLRIHSAVELNLSSAAVVPGEGTAYAYYASGNRIKTLNGAVTTYWTRSPRSNNTTQFCYVDAAGTLGGSGASALSGITFAFDI